MEGWNGLLATQTASSLPEATPQIAALGLGNKGQHKGYSNYSLGAWEEKALKSAKPWPQDQLHEKGESAVLPEPQCLHL